MIDLPLGPVFAAVPGIELAAGDRERLLHPLVGGVTLFTRNYVDPRQLRALCDAIHALRRPQLVICVDHEGGRVQRFRDGFTRVPPMRRIGAAWAADATHGRALARAVGSVIAGELRACGVDLSFAPVLDLDYGASSIIGDRAFHAEPEAVAELAGCVLEGLNACGMAGVGKHYPGHGYIRADSHLELPVDDRDMGAIAARDLLPFRRLAPRLAGIMAAHVLYPRVDAKPAGFSTQWLERILRADLGFAGAVLSDDIGMAGAACAGDLVARAQTALEAGCDAVLACSTDDADAVLARLRYDMPEASRLRLQSLAGPRGSHPTAGAADLAAVRELLATLGD